MAAGGRLSRVRVRCVSRDGAEEETLLVPIPSGGHWTVVDLLTRVQERARQVPSGDLEELELDEAQGGRFHPEDPLEDVLQEGDLLLCTVAQGSRPRSIPPPQTSGSSCAPAKGKGKHIAPERPPAQAPRRNTELETSYARIFGDGGGEKEDAGAESDESPTPPAPGMHCPSGPPAAASRPPPRATYHGAWRMRPPPVSVPIVPQPLVRRSRSPARRTLCEQAPLAALQPEPEGREAKWPPLLRAVYNGDVQTTEELLRQGADVNCTMAGAGQKTPIYYAIRFEVPALVRLLLSHPEIDVHREMRLGRGGCWTTPLDAAREAGPSSSVYQVFVEHGFIEERGPEVPQRASGPLIVPRLARRVLPGRWPICDGEPDTPEDYSPSHDNEGAEGLGGPC